MGALTLASAIARGSICALASNRFYLYAKSRMDAVVQGPTRGRFPGGRPIELVFGSCGWGWHRNYWKDRWGNLHRGRCVRDW